MCRARSAYGGLLSAPAKQTQSGEAGGEEREGGRERRKDDVVDITRTTEDMQSDLQVVDSDARVGVANRVETERAEATRLYPAHRIFLYTTQRASKREVNVTVVGCQINRGECKRSTCYIQRVGGGATPNKSSKQAGYWIAELLSLEEFTCCCINGEPSFSVRRR